MFPAVFTLGFCNLLVPEAVLQMLCSYLTGHKFLCSSFLLLLLGFKKGDWNRKECAGQHREELELETVWPNSFFLFHIAKDFRASCCGDKMQHFCACCSVLVFFFQKREGVASGMCLLQPHAMNPSPDTEP